MFALASLLFVAFPPAGADPADDDALPASPDVQVRVAVKSVNGVPASRATTDDLWPLDDVVVTADGSTSSASPIASYAWELVKKPDESDVALIADGADARFVFDLKGRKIGGLDEPGAYRVRAIVTSTSGEASHHDLVVRVKWPGQPDADRDSTQITASSSWKSTALSAHKAPAPDAKTGARNVDATVGSTAACCATLGGGVACACATASIGGGVVSGGVLMATGPLATVAATSGAALAMASDGAHFDDLSPWLLVGSGVELAGVLVLGATIGATQLFAATGRPIDNAYYMGASVIGVGLMLVGLPVPIVAAWATSRPDSR